MQRQVCTATISLNSHRRVATRPKLVAVFPFPLRIIILSSGRSPKPLNMTAQLQDATHTSIVSLPIANDMVDSFSAQEFSWRKSEDLSLKFSATQAPMNPEELFLRQNGHERMQQMQTKFDYCTASYMASYQNALSMNANITSNHLARSSGQEIKTSLPPKFTPAPKSGNVQKKRAISFRKSSRRQVMPSQPNK